jgi:hypothetical protein
MLVMADGVEIKLDLLNGGTVAQDRNVALNHLQLHAIWEY